jgi:hypothetical protein
MDLDHWVLLGVVIVGIAIPIVWFWPAARVPSKEAAVDDDGVDAAAALVLKELRERTAGRK